MRCGSVVSDFVVSKSRSTASSAISTSATTSRCLPSRKRAPESPVICRISGEEPPIPQHRIALLAAERRQHDQPALVGIVRRRAAGRSSGRSPAACRPGRPARRRTPRAPRRCRPSGWRTVPRRSRGRARSAPAGRPARAGSARPGARSPPAPAAHWRTARCPPRGRSSPCRCGRPPAACCAAPCGATGRPPGPPRRWWAHCAARCRCAACAGAFSRGSGRTSISFSRPPTPIRMISAGRPAGRRTAGSARSRCRSASGCARSRAAPARALAPIRPRQIRLPGSTGMPKCRISPPACTMPAGPTSRRSTTAEAPTTSSRSAPCEISASSALPIGASSCGVRSGGSSEPVSWVIRCSVAAMVFSVTLSFRPGSSVTTRPTFR